jgi:type II secretory pathway component PulK
VSRRAAPVGKAGFALPAVLFVVAMVTLVFLVAIESLSSLANETRAARRGVLFQVQALSLEADVAYAAATRPLGPARVMRAAAPNAGALFALDGTPYNAGNDLTVATQDEAGLINIDQLPVAAMPRLFAAMGVSRDGQTMMTDRLADYLSVGDLKRPQGAKADDYLHAGLPPPPDGPLRRRDQLLGVMGWSDAVDRAAWRSFADNVTADPTSITANVNTATPAMLEVVYGLTPAQAHAALARRAQAPFTALSDMGRTVGLALPGDAELVYTLPSGRFAVKIENRLAGLAYRSRILLSPADAERPFWIVEPAVSSLTAAEKASPPANVPTSADVLAFPDPAA